MKGSAKPHTHRGAAHDHDPLAACRFGVEALEALLEVLDVTDQCDHVTTLDHGIGIGNECPALVLDGRDADSGRQAHLR